MIKYLLMGVAIGIVVGLLIAFCMVDVVIRRLKKDGR